VTNERRSIIAKIKKILARTKSPNEHEAATATAMAQAELAKHNIDISEVESLDANERKVGEDRFESINRPRHRTIRRACAQMYFCQYYHMRHGTKVINVYIGEPHNIEIAKLMSDYLITTVWRLTQEAYKAAHQPRSSPYTNSFANACAGRVAERIYERIEQTKRGTTVMEGNRNLPVLAPLYDQAKRANAEFLRSQGVRLYASRSRQRFNSADGVAHGRRAGDTIGLDAQINSPKAKLLR
jgi:hypothetical protein